MPSKLPRIQTVIPQEYKDYAERQASLSGHTVSQWLAMLIKKHYEENNPPASR